MKVKGMFNVVLLGIVSFLNDVSSEMIFPILPLFLVDLGASSVAIGLIGGVRDSITSLLKVVSGFFSDKTGKRKIYVFSGYFISAISKFLLAFSRIWQHALAFVSLERTGKGIRDAPRDAIIAESMPDHRGKGFGIHRALDTTGAVLGSLACLLLFWIWGLSFKTIILAAGLISFVSLFPLHFVRETRKKPRKLGFSLALEKIPKKVRIAIFIVAIFALANFSYMFFILKAIEMFNGFVNARQSAIFAIAFYVLYNVFYAAFSIPFGKLADSIGKTKVLAIGYCLFALTALAFALFNSWKIYMFLFICYGLVYALVEGNQRAFIADLSPEKLRATCLGAFHTTIGLVALPASLIAGLLWKISSVYTFLFGSIVAGIAAILILSFKD